MKYIDVLKGVDKLLSDESKHAIAAMARNKEGKVVEPTSKTAVCWCLIGAVRKVMDIPQDSYGDSSYALVVKKLSKALPGGILHYNDGMGYPAVKKFIRQQLKELNK